MARMPQGAAHIANPVSTAPGFVIGNVHVMAGVPQVFQAMVDAVLPTLRSGAKMLSRAVSCPYGEGDIGTLLADIQKAHPDTSIGSYPRFDGKKFSTEIVVRARAEGPMDAAAEAVIAMIAELDRAGLAANPTADA
jgi:molybdopterin-biosynthesis enzyme MoeA-like protein